MTLDLDLFVKKINSIVRRNRTIYDLLEFFAVVLTLLFLTVFFNLSDFFKYIPFTEPYVGLSPGFPLSGIRYEVIFSFFIVCLLSFLVFGIMHKNRKLIYTKLHIIPPKREKATNIVERFYPQLKDRLNTAYDNKSNNNIVTGDLIESVTNDIGSVTSSGLFDLKRLSYSLGAILISGVLLTAVAFTGVTAPFSPDNLLERPPSGTIEQPPPTPETNSSTTVPTDIPPISAEPGVDIDVTLPPGAGVGPGDLLENSTENIFQPSEYYPPESLSSQHYYEVLPEGYEDVIKDYFKKLAEKT